MKAGNNPEFLSYVQKKIMERLTILAAYCPKEMKIDDILNLKNRGAHIFLPDERDEKSASDFLVVLLNSIEQWAITYKKDSRTGEETLFRKAYSELLVKGVSFPSELKKYKQPLKTTKNERSSSGNQGSRNQ